MTLEYQQRVSTDWIPDLIFALCVVGVIMLLPYLRKPKR